MSIALMTEAWKLQDLSSTQKLVLLSLADNANDQGECYPSMAQVSRRTCLSERAVRDAIRSLEAMGYVRSVSRLGTSTMYHLTTTPAAAAAPAGNAPRQEMPPRAERAAPPPRQEVPPTPAAAAPKPSINRQLNRQLTVKARTAIAAIELPDWLPRSAWVDWVEHRIAVKAPLTERAASMGIRLLEKLKDQGHDPVEVIEQSVRTGKWTDFYPLKNQTAGSGKRPTQSQANAQWMANLWSDPQPATVDMGTFDASTGQPV